jgi:FkbM family methyltransferase
VIWNISPDETNEKIISYAKTNDWMIAGGKIGVKPVNTWQKDFTKIVVDYVDNFHTCIDVGSHYGFLTKEFSSYFDNVYAFEMNKKIYDYFLQNVSDCNNIKSFNVALYNEDNDHLLSTDDLDSGQNKIDKNGKIEVKGKTLDSYKLENVGLIKLDIQGGEFKALEGSIETLKNNNPIVVVEILNRNMYDMYLKNKKTIELLFSLNYEIVNNLRHDVIFRKKKHV